MLRFVRGVLWIIVTLHDHLRLLCSIPPAVCVQTKYISTSSISYTLLCQFVPDQLMGHAVCWTGLHSLGARGQYFTSAGCG